MKYTISILSLGAAPLAVLTLCASFSHSQPTSTAKAALHFTPQEAHLDIKPGSCPNPINVNTLADDELECIGGMMLGVVPVSILGNKFDVDQVDVGTVTLSRPGNLSDVVIHPIQINFGDTGTPFEGEGCDCHALAGDGVLDLDFKFSKAEMIEAFGLQDEEDGTFIQLQISGISKGEIEFVGHDCIRIINR